MQIPREIRRFIYWQMGVIMCGRTCTVLSKLLIDRQPDIYNEKSAVATHVMCCTPFQCPTEQPVFFVIHPPREESVGWSLDARHVCRAPANIHELEGQCRSHSLYHHINSQIQSVLSSQPSKFS